MRVRQHELRVVQRGYGYQCRRVKQRPERPDALCADRGSHQGPAGIKHHSIVRRGEHVREPVDDPAQGVTGFDPAEADPVADK